MKLTEKAKEVIANIDYSAVEQRILAYHGIDLTNNKPRTKEEKLAQYKKFYGVEAKEQSK